MDQTTLVETQIEDGKELLEHLGEVGIAVTVACWLKDSEDGPWYLYLATPLVSPEGDKVDAYGTIIDAIRRQPTLTIDPMEIKVINPENAIAKDVAKILEKQVKNRGIYHKGRRLGRLNVEGAYIYPPIACATSKQ